MVKGATKQFDKYNQALLCLLGKIEGRKVPYKSVLECFENNKEIALAVYIQNCLQPKNNMRVEAVKNATYVEITSQQIAQNYLSDLLKKNLETELKATES